MTTACRRPRAAGLAAAAVGSAALLAACQPQAAGSANPSPSARSATGRPVAPSASPSPACPDAADIIAAADSDAGVSGYQLSDRGLLACERGYATAEVTYPGAGEAIVVLHLVAGKWQAAMMGSDVCDGEGDDGLKRPQWMVGVPDSVIAAAHCQPTTYHD
jgi:hypothetical protein